MYKRAEPLLPNPLDLVNTLSANDEWQISRTYEDQSGWFKDQREKNPSRCSKVCREIRGNI